MSKPTLYGPAYSTYTRSARLAMEEKGVDYDLVEVDFLQGPMPAEQIERHPFAKVPALLHNGFKLYEVTAINRYVDEQFEGPPLQPDDSKERARMNQIISVLDNHGYRAMVWDVFVQRSSVPADGGEADEELIASALPGIGALLRQLDQWRGEQRFLAGETLTLADLHFYPMLHYFIETPEGAALLDDFPRLQQWLHDMQNRDSVRATGFNTNTNDDNDAVDEPGR